MMHRSVARMCSLVLAASLLVVTPNAGRAQLMGAEIQIPEPNAVILGTTPVTAQPLDNSVDVHSATFSFTPAGGSPTLIGTDTRGAVDEASCFVPSNFGPGWSVLWNTSTLAAGNYTLTATLQTNVGPLTATTRVFVTHTLLVPYIAHPNFDDTVFGAVPILATRALGSSATFQVKPQDSTVAFPFDPTNQHDFPFDSNAGRTMCDPSSQTARLFTIKAVHDAFVALPSVKAACKGKTGAAFEACAKRIFVATMAALKGTNPLGTGFAAEVTGSKGLFAALGLAAKGFQAVRLPNARTFKDLKTAATAPPKGAPKGSVVKGVIMHIQPVGANTPKHAVDLTKINDKVNPDKTHDVCFMDPETGKEVCVKMAPDGSFAYPTAAGAMWRLQTAEQFIGPPDPVAPQLAQLPLQSVSPDGFITIAVVTVRGPLGWAATWNTSAFAAGIYWIRVIINDGLGHTGQDQIEVNLVKLGAAPGVLRLR